MDGEYSSWRPRTTPAEQPGGGLFGRLRANVQRGAARVQQAVTAAPQGQPSLWDPPASDAPPSQPDERTLWDPPVAGGAYRPPTPATAADEDAMLARALQESMQPQAPPPPPGPVVPPPAAASDFFRGLSLGGDAPPPPAPPPNPPADEPLIALIRDFLV